MDSNELIQIEFSTDESHALPWKIVDPFIRSTESLLTSAMNLVLDHSNSDYYLSEHNGMSMSLAAAPKKGSLLLTFLAQFPTSANLDAIVSTAHKVPMSAISEWIGTVADSIQIASFLQNSVFGRRGAIARRSAQLTGDVGAGREEKATESFSESIVRSSGDLIDQVFSAAIETGCTSVSIITRDGDRIELVLPSYRRGRQLLAINGDSEYINNQVKDIPNFNIIIQRIDVAPIKVDVIGHDSSLDAFMFKLADSNLNIMGVWASKIEAPKVNESVEVKWSRIYRKDVSPVDDVSGPFQKADAIFLIASSRPNWG